MYLHKLHITHICNNIKYGTFDFHSQTLKPYQKNCYLMYQRSNGLYFWYLMKFCIREMIKLCISAENGYRHKEMNYFKSINREYAQMLKSTTRERAEIPLNQNVCWTCWTWRPKLIRQSFGNGSTNRLTQRQLDNCQQDCWWFCQRAKGWEYHPMSGILLFVFEAFSFTFRPIFLFGSNASKIHRFF